MRWWITFWLCVAVLSLLAMGQAPPARAGSASCYADGTDGFLGGTTADGSTVHPHTIGVASRTLSFTTWLWVKVDGGTPLRVRVIDRGPYATDQHGRYTRTLDLTWGTARALGFNSCAAWGVRRIHTWRAR